MSVLRLTNIISSPKTLLILMAVVFIIAIGTLFSGSKEPGDLDPSAKLPVVSLTTPLEYVGGQTISLIGTVRAFNEAEITSERSGRVTSVAVSLGQQVRAGQLIATLDNSLEQAAVLQAEGVYEAALAASKQGDVSLAEANNAVRSAQNVAVATFQSSYNTTNSVVRNSIDDFFANPDGRVPGLKINGNGLTSYLNTERVAYQDLLPVWQNKANTISINSDLASELAFAKTSVQRTINFIDNFVSLFANQKKSNGYTDDELESFAVNFTNLREVLIGVQSSLDRAESGLISAAEGLNRAQIASSGGQVSAADAQVKQALGVLRAAEANLAKTVYRTPVSGTVNQINVRTGDFVNSFELIARVANNQALEVITSATEAERQLLKVGDNVVINEADSGVISQISPVVDPASRKIEIRIAVEGTKLINGDTVRVTKELSESTTSAKPILIPLSAIRFEETNGSIMTVDGNSLVSVPVVLGSVRGGSVEVLEGMTFSTQFVLDVRGLTPGSEVVVQN